ncbi:uncharacterized protein [Aquarana catesbeiana]|uniref:uncharacterized protein n=1 Tax=Aquarana catesbeiana TaxID=8400 RepID=UPI003CC96157
MQHLFIFHSHIFHSSLQLLWKDQEGRNHLVSDIRSHPFFKTIDWAELEGRKSDEPPESEPIYEEPSNNSMPLNEFIKTLDREAPISPYEQEYFTGFSYMSDSLMMSPMELFSPPPSSPEKPNFADCSDESELQREEPMDWDPILSLKIQRPVPTPMENHYKDALQQLAELMVVYQPPPAVRQENLFTPWPMHYEEAHKNPKEPEEPNNIYDFGYKRVSQIQQPPQDFFPMAYNQENLFTPWPMYHEEAHNNLIEPEEQNNIYDFGCKRVSQIQEPPQDFFPTAYSQENLFTPWPMYHEEAHNNVIEPEAQQHLCDIFLPPERQDSGLTPWPCIMRRLVTTS